MGAVFHLSLYSLANMEIQILPSLAIEKWVRKEETYGSTPLVVPSKPQRRNSRASDDQGGQVHIHLDHGLGSARLGKGCRSTVEEEGIANTVLAKDLGEVVVGLGMFVIRVIVMVRTGRPVRPMLAVLVLLDRVVNDRGPRLSFVADPRRWSAVLDALYQF